MRASPYSLSSSTTVPGDIVKTIPPPVFWKMIMKRNRVPVNPHRSFSHEDFESICYNRIPQTVLTYTDINTECKEVSCIKNRMIHTKEGDGRTGREWQEFAPTECFHQGIWKVLNDTELRLRGRKSLLTGDRFPELRKASTLRSPPHLQPGRKEKQAIPNAMTLLPATWGSLNSSREGVRSQGSPRRHQGLFLAF